MRAMREFIASPAAPRLETAFGRSLGRVTGQRVERGFGDGNAAVVVVVVLVRQKILSTARATSHHIRVGCKVMEETKL